MAKEEVLEMNGVVSEALPDGRSRVQLDNGHNLVAYSANAVGNATISFTSSGLTGVTSSAFTIPAPIHSSLNGVTVLAGGKFKFTFTNATGLGFSVLATNDLTAPTANWPVLGQAVESPAGSGSYQFTNSTPATNGSLFFILRQP